MRSHILRPETEEIMEVDYAGKKLHIITHDGEE